MDLLIGPAIAILDSANVVHMSLDVDVTTASLAFGTLILRTVAFRAHVTL